MLKMKTPLRMQRSFSQIFVIKKTPLLESVDIHKKISTRRSGQQMLGVFGYERFEICTIEADAVHVAKIWIAS